MALRLDELPDGWLIRQEHSARWLIVWRGNVLDSRTTWRNAMVRAKRMVQDDDRVRRLIIEREKA